MIRDHRKFQEGPWVAATISWWGPFDDTLTEKEKDELRTPENLNVETMLFSTWAEAADHVYYLTEVQDCDTADILSYNLQLYK